MELAIFALLCFALYFLLNWKRKSIGIKKADKIGTWMILGFPIVFGLIGLFKGLYFLVIQDYQWEENGNIAAPVLIVIGSVCLIAGLWSIRTVTGKRK